MNNVASDVADGHLAGIWGMQQEITHRKRQQEKRQEMRRTLSKKQYLLLQLLSEKYATKEAASVKGITENTAHKHLARAMKKLGIHNRDVLLQYVRGIGLSQTHLSEKHSISDNRPLNVTDSVTSR
ncbi:MAG TPA: LuxR C-terminal-related transcriptional regulator [Bacteroidota bacterium]